MPKIFKVNLSKKWLDGDLITIMDLDLENLVISVTFEERFVNIF